MQTILKNIQISMSFLYRVPGKHSSNIYLEEKYSISHNSCHHLEIDRTLSQLNASFDTLYHLICKSLEQESRDHREGTSMLADRPGTWSVKRERCAL